MTDRPMDAADPDLYDALNVQGDLRSSDRVLLEHFMGALLELRALEAAAESYLTSYGPERLAELIVGHPLAWVLAYLDSQQ